MKFDDRDFEDEIRTHLEMATADRIADGADRRSAELASLKEFGNVTPTTSAVGAAASMGRFFGEGLHQAKQCWTGSNG
jgi:hypothetical protein